MKILFSTGCLTNKGGTYFRAYYLAQELTKRGHQVTIASISPSSRFRRNEQMDSGVRIIEFPNFMHKLVFHHGDGPLDIAQRTRLILKEDFDIVHGFEYFADVMVPIILTKKRKHYLYISDWCDWFSKGMALKERRFAWFKAGIKAIAWLEEQARIKSSGVTVISQELEHKVSSMGIPENKILRLPGGAPVDLIRPMSKLEVRKALGYPANARIAVFLGISLEDLDLFLVPFAKVSSEQPPAILLMLGYYEPDKLRKRIQGFGIENKVIAAGGIPPAEVDKYLACADVCLLPLRDNEGNRSRWPNKIGDYMSAGRPTIASKVGEVVPIMEKNDIGFLVSNDAREIAERMTWLFANPSASAVMGDTARKLAESKYSWAALAAALESFYVSCNNQRLEEEDKARATT